MSYIIEYNYDCSVYTRRDYYDRFDTQLITFGTYNGSHGYSNGYVFLDGSNNLILYKDGGYHQLNDQGGSYSTIYNNGSSYGNPSGINFTNGLAVSSSGYGVDVYVSNISGGDITSGTISPTYLPVADHTNQGIMTGDEHTLVVSSGVGVVPIDWDQYFVPSFSDLINIDNITHQQSFVTKVGEHIKVETICIIDLPVVETDTFCSFITSIPYSSNFTNVLQVAGSGSIFVYDTPARLPSLFPIANVDSPSADSVGVYFTVPTNPSTSTLYMTLSYTYVIV